MNHKYFTLLPFLLFFLIRLNADNLKTEKVRFELDKDLVHPTLYDKNNKTSKVGIDIVIPTSPVTKDAWKLRVWECQYNLTKSIQLLEIGISYQINAFILSAEQYLKADKIDQKKFSDLCKEYKIKVYFSSPKFGIPLKSSQLKTLKDICNIPITSGVLLNFKKISLSEKQTKQYLDLIYNSITNKKLEIFVEPFSIHSFFMKALNSIKNDKVIPVQNWVDNKWSLTAPFSTRIKNHKKPQLVRMDISLEQYGENRSFALMQDYIGFRQTQCLEVAPNALGIIVSFGDSITSFGTMNAINIYTISELLLDKEKDIDIINYQWFSTMYGEKVGDALFELTANTINIIRKTIYIREHSDTRFSDKMIPMTPEQFLTYTQFDKWFKVNRKKAISATLIYREKIWAEELINKLLKNYTRFSKKNNLKDRKITLAQMAYLKKKVTLFKHWTKLLLKAQYHTIKKNDIDLAKLKGLLKTNPSLKSSLDSFAEIYIDQKKETISSIPLEHLPAYISNKLKQAKDKKVNE